MVGSVGHCFLPRHIAVYESLNRWNQPQKAT